MTTFKHKTLPIEISYLEYVKLSENEKVDFTIFNPQNYSTTNNITNTNIKHETKDVLGIGEVATVAVAVPLIAVGSLFGLFD